MSIFLGRAYARSHLGHLVTAATSHGLRDMADRIGALGGTLSVDSSPGGGTTVRGAVPTASRMGTEVTG